MFRPSTMIVVMFCGALMFLTNDVTALDFTNADPENCYLVAVPHNSANGLGSDANSATESTQSIGTYLASFDLQALPVPASLLFIAVWLIGFKLTTQPSPTLSRVEPSRYSKAYMEMSMGEKPDPTSC